MVIELMVVPFGLLLIGAVMAYEKQNTPAPKVNKLSIELPNY